MNQPLINFEDYSVSALLFNGIGCLLWVGAYVILVLEIRKKKFVEMIVCNYKIVAFITKLNIVVNFYE